MLINIPLFSGFNNFDQLVKISQIIGTPNWRRLPFIRNLKKIPKIPEIKAYGLKNMLPMSTSSELVDLLNHMLKWNPKERLNAA